MSGQLYPRRVFSPKFLRKKRQKKAKKCKKRSFSVKIINFFSFCIFLIFSIDFGKKKWFKFTSGIYILAVFPQITVKNAVKKWWNLPLSKVNRKNFCEKKTPILAKKVQKRSFSVKIINFCSFWVFLFSQLILVKKESNLHLE